MGGGHLDANTNADQLSRTGQTNGALPAQPALTAQPNDVCQGMLKTNLKKSICKNFKGLLFQVTANINPKLIAKHFWTKENIKSCFVQIWKIFHLNADWRFHIWEIWWPKCPILFILWAGWFFRFLDWLQMPVYAIFSSGHNLLLTLDLSIWFSFRWKIFLEY